MSKPSSLFPFDPALLDLLAGWVNAPVVFDGRTIDRAKLRRGLPQGAAISSLLANLYLDELDEKLTREGFRLVLFADDCAPRRRGKEAVMAT